MHDLCVQQTDTPAYAGPYLRISPLEAGLVEFRYVDTAVAKRQWHRVVSPEDAPARLRSFLGQLHWLADTKPVA
jgi:hypothetical protein